MSTALVTGATRGIGRATALALDGDGWWVLATGTDEQAGGGLADELARGDFVAADLRDDGAADRLVGAAVEATGRLDLLVNNAGTHALGAIPETSPADYDELMAVNLRAPFLLVRAALPVMIDQGGGVIVNVCSEAGLTAVPDQAPYNMSKAALIMLTRSIVADHAADGIRAVSVCPGTTRTPLVERAIDSADDPEAHERMLAESRPAGRLGTPEEIARVIAFAARGDVSYLTGSELVVDGGRNAV